MAFDPNDQLSIVPVVARQSALMVQACHAWPSERWEHATYCEGWTAANVMAHLTTGAAYYTHVIAAGRTGPPSLPWGATNLDEVRIARAELERDLYRGGPQTLLSGFEQAVQALQEVFESLQTEMLSRLAWYPRGPIPIGQWIGMRLIELSLHDWDIRQPHESSIKLSSIARPALLTCLPEMQNRLLSYRLPDLPSGIYAMCAGESAWAFCVQDQQITYRAEVPATPTAYLHTDAETLILLTLGRVDFAAILDRADAELSGDEANGRSFCNLLFSPYLSASATT